MKNQNSSIRRKAVISALFAAAAVFAANAAKSAKTEFPPLGPLGAVPIPPDNPTSAVKVELGKMLYFDTRTSGDGSIACSTCHEPAMGWGDGADVSRGYPGSQHWRNTQTILNSAYHLKFFWAGEKTSLEAQARSAMTGNLAGNGDPMMIEERLAQIPKYVSMFQKAFGTPRPLFNDVLKAISAFERVVPISRNVPFDNYIKGDKGALSAQALRGLTLFKGKAGCIRCHNGALFSDQDYHALGVPKNPVFEEDPLRQVALRYQHFSRGVSEKLYRATDRDYGLYYTTKRAVDKGKFRTPSLRELKVTPPYMHNGVFFTLEEVVDFYNQGGGKTVNKSPLIVPLGLADAEKEDLIAFLGALDGDEIIVEPPTLPEYAKTVYP